MQSEAMALLIIITISKYTLKIKEVYPLT